MTQTLDLNKMGLKPLNNLEIIEVEGGGLADKMAKLLYDAFKGWGAEKIFDASLAYVVDNAKHASHNSHHNASWIDK